MNIKKLIALVVIATTSLGSIALFARRYNRRRAPQGGISIGFGIGGNPRYYRGRPGGWYRHRYPSYRYRPSFWWATPYFGPYFGYTDWTGERIRIRNYEELKEQMDHLENKLNRIERRMRRDLSREEMRDLRKEMNTLQDAQERLYKIKDQLDEANIAK